METKQHQKVEGLNGVAESIGYATNRSERQAKSARPIHRLAAVLANSNLVRW